MTTENEKNEKPEEKLGPTQAELQARAAEADRVRSARNVAEASATAAPTGPAPAQAFSHAGRMFTARGKFGADKGHVTVGGVPARVTSWSDERIKGELPEGAKAGEAVLANGKKIGALREAT